MNRYADAREGIDLLELIQQIKTYFWVLLLAAALTGTAGFLISRYWMEPQYESAITMIVNTRQDSGGTVTNDNITSAQNLVSTYSVIIKSNTVLNEVIARLSLPTTYQKLEQRVYVNAVEDTQIMRVAVRDSSRGQAAAIVSAIAAIAPDIIVETVEAGSCKVISQVMTGSKPVTPNILKNTLLSAIGGWMAAVFGIVLYSLLRVRKIQDDRDAQVYLELPVLGVIPEIRVEDL